MARTSYINGIFICKLSLLALILCFKFPRTVTAQNKKIDSLTALSQQHLQKDDIRAKILFNLAELYLRTDVKRSVQLTDEVISFENKIKEKGNLSATYRIKGIAQYYQAMYPEALLSFNRALTINREIKNSLGMAGDLSNIGTIYLSQSKFPEALSVLLQALQQYDNLKGNELKAANTAANIGIVYTEMGDFDQAMKNHQKALLIYQKFKYLNGEASVYTNIGTVHFKNNNMNQAIKYSKLSLKIADSISDFNIMARENGNLSAYYNKIKQPEVALKYGLKSIEINQKIGNKRSLGINYQNVSSAYLSLQDFSKSKFYAISALQIGKDLNVTEIKRDASLGLSELYEETNQPDSALYHFRNFSKFSDSISNDTKKAEVIKMGLQYDFDKKELSYQQKQQLDNEQLKQQELQLALNYAAIKSSIQQSDLQEVQLINEKLINEEKQKELLISKNNEKLQVSKVKALSQEQKLSKLELNQLWLFGILAVVTLISILIYLLNLYRLRRLRFKNTLQLQAAEQAALKLKYQYQLSESELKAIRSQMNPHFIFNVLNSIEAYIMDNDKKTASRLVQKFASLSRLILENSTKSLVTGDKEWKGLMLYTELEAMRYNDSFSYTFIVDEQVQLNKILLPPMLIQPLIENAILHGLIIDNKPDAHLEVKLEQRDAGICITVKDNGQGINSKTEVKQTNYFKEKSMGIKSISERINMINITNDNTIATFELKAGENNRGTIAKVCLPMLRHYVEP